MRPRTQPSVFHRRAPQLLASTGVAAMLGGALLLGASPAALADGGCPTGSTLVSAGVCEATFTSSGTFTPPATTTKLEALLVGAGGGGNGGYGGGGGDVRIVDLSSSGEVTVTVGAGGTLGGGGTGIGGASSVAQGSTTESADGGFVGENGSTGGGASGNSNEGSFNSGGGAGGNSADNVTGGPGIVVSDLASTLFLSLDACFGGGGAGFDYGATTSLATCGGGYSTNVVSNTGSGPYNPNTGSADIFLAVANSGGGAGTVIDFDNVAQWTGTANVTGADGYVALRFSVTDLASTGADASTVGITAGVSAGLLAVGAGALVLARRARRS